MRGRRGAYIGSPPQDTADAIWRLGEVFSIKRSGLWGGNSIQASLYSYDAVDVTESGTIYGFSSSSGYPSVAYQWERSVDSGATWSPVSGETGTSITLSSQTSANDGDLYRLTASGGGRTAASPPAAVFYETSMAISFLVQPADLSVAAGQEVYFDSYAEALGLTSNNYYTVSYQWQESLDSGSSWSDMAGETLNDIIIASAAAEMNGRQYRVIASAGESSSASSIATLTVT